MWAWGGGGGGGHEGRHARAAPFGTDSGRCSRGSTWGDSGRLLLDLKMESRVNRAQQAERDLRAFDGGRIIAPWW